MGRPEQDPSLSTAERRGGRPASKEGVRAEVGLSWDVGEGAGCRVGGGRAVLGGEWAQTSQAHLLHALPFGPQPASPVRTGLASRARVNPQAIRLSPLNPGRGFWRLTSLKFWGRLSQGADEASSRHPRHSRHPRTHSRARAPQDLGGLGEQVGREEGGPSEAHTPSVVLSHSQRHT